MSFALASALLLVSGLAWARTPPVRLAAGADWTDDPAARPAPQAWAFDHRDICRKGQDACLARWRDHLTRLGLSDLTAPVGGAAYRWLWVSPDWRDAKDTDAPHDGYVEVTIEPSGAARLRSTLAKGQITLPPGALAAFEAAMARSEFTAIPRFTGHNCLDECPYHLMEVVIDGRYRFVERDAGISEPGLYGAGAMLEKLALASLRR